MATEPSVDNQIHALRCNCGHYSVGTIPGGQLEERVSPRCTKLLVAVIREREEAYQCGLRDGRHNPSLDEALNSGDGVYRP